MIKRKLYAMEFDEFWTRLEAGGTMHIALGNGYPQTGSVNRSALHWDLVLDTRKGGRVSMDGRVVLENGAYTI